MIPLSHCSIVLLCAPYAKRDETRRGINKLFQWFSRNLRANILHCLQCLPGAVPSHSHSHSLSFALTDALLFVLAYLLDLCRFYHAIKIQSQRAIAAVPSGLTLPTHCDRGGTVWSTKAMIAWWIQETTSSRSGSSSSNYRSRYTKPMP